MDLVNNVENDDVRLFHQDNFAEYKDYGLELKRIELTAKVMRETETSNQSAEPTNGEQTENGNPKKKL